MNRPYLRAGFCIGALAYVRASDTAIPHSAFRVPHWMNRPYLRAGFCIGALAYARASALEPLLTRGPRARRFRIPYSEFRIG